MNIPPKYEDVVANLDAALAREAALRNDVLTLQKGGQLIVRDMHDYRKRLTVAEQRSSELESAAREMLRIAAIANQGSKAYNRAIINLHSSLNPATEQVGLGSGKPVPPSKPVAPPIRRVVNDLVINKSEIEAHTTRNWRS